MTAHRFDITSLVLGLAAVAMAVAAWTGRLGELINHPGAAIPIVVGLVGVALVASARRTTDRAQPISAQVVDDD